VPVIAGDDDDTTLEVAMFFKRTIPRCGLLMLPKTGHGINLEEPGDFNEPWRTSSTISSAGAGVQARP